MIINEIMNSFWNDKKTKEELLSLYQHKVTNADVKIGLETASKNKDVDLLGNSFLVGFWFELFDAGAGQILSDLLLENWHRKHEDIAGIFQRIANTNKANIPVLMEAIHSIPGYLQEEDFKYPYIRKLIYAIGAQPEPDNIKALKELAQSNDEEINELALHQIEKRERRDR